MIVETTLSALDMVVEALIKVLSPIVIFILLWIIGKIIYRYFKYGMIEFRIFRKKDNAKFNEIIISMLDKIDGFRRIYKPQNLYADLVIVDKTGIYLLKLIKYIGIVTGNRKDTKLKNKVKLNQTLTIDNPFYYLDKDVINMHKINKDWNIKLILVTSNVVNINIDKVKKDECLLLKDFYYYINRIFNDSGIYSEDEVKEIYKQLKKTKNE